MAPSRADGPHCAVIIAAEPTLACCIAGEAKRTATRFLKLACARLALGIMCTVAPVQFVRLFGPVQGRQLWIEITLLEGMPVRLCDLLAMGKLDVASMARPNGFPAPLHAWKLYSERFVIASSVGASVCHGE